METSCWDYCGHGCRSNDEQASCYSIGSSSSGTIVSTATYTSSASRLSSVSTRAAMSVLDRWLMELGVGADGASAGILELTPKPMFPDRSSMMTSIYEEEPEAESGKQPSSREHQFQIAQFFQETMLKMHPFVDVRVNKDVTKNGVSVLPHVKFRTLLRVHLALSNALSGFRFRFGSPASAEAQRIKSEIASLLWEKEYKVREAIWSTMEEIRTRVLESMEDLSSTQTPLVSSGIYKLTWSVMRYITFLLQNFWAVAPIVSEADRLGKYVPQTADAAPLDSMIIEMASCLEERLVTMSGSFPDQGLRFLFLLNNSHFMWGKLHYYTPTLPPFRLDRFSREVLLNKAGSYIKRYLWVSWVPLLSCLFNPAPLCFGRNYSPLSKFESELQKTCTIQKQWKVPDPQLRKMLRGAIIEIIIPVYEKYIEDNEVTTQKITLQVLEEMLQELFEG